MALDVEHIVHRGVHKRTLYGSPVPSQRSLPVLFTCTAPCQPVRSTSASAAVCKNATQRTYLIDDCSRTLLSPTSSRN